MKNILLACVLLTATSTITYAQAIRPTASKSDLVTKQGQLNTFILAGDMTNAQLKWAEINKVVQNEFGVIKFRLIDDAKSGDMVDKALCLKRNSSQRTLYADMVVQKNNLVTNRAALMSDLNLFEADMF
jgi:hypothetical protein